MCKNIFLAALFLSANIQMLFAATGSRSDDFLVVLVPLLFLAMMWALYEVKAKLKARKEAAANASTEENFTTEES